MDLAMGMIGLAIVAVGLLGTIVVLGAFLWDCLINEEDGKLAQWNNKRLEAKRPRVTLR